MVLFYIFKNIKSANSLIANNNIRSANPKHIIIRHIYEFKEIDTRITKNEMRELMLLCTKNVHFTFNVKAFTQVDSVTMRSPLAPILAGIFMVELERKLIPMLKDHLSCWRRYFDDTICFIKNGSVEHVLSTLNNFHSSIKFTYEQKVVTSYPS